MPDETTPAVEQGTGTPIDQIPTDFREYDRWRRTGELPAAREEKTEKPSATADESAPPSGEPEEQVKTAPESEPDDSQEAEESQPQRPSSRQRRIDKLTRENAELQRRLEALEQRSTTPPPVEAQPANASAQNGRPVLKDFQTLEEYTETLTEWKINQREAAAKAENEKRAAQAAERALQDSWAAKDAAAAKAHPDYRELMDATEIPVGPGVLAARQALLEEDNGAEILYWLISRPEELKRVAALSPAKAVLEIGKLAATLAPPEKPKAKVTSAPRPPAPLSHGVVRTADNVYDDQTARDFKRWSRAREAQLRE